MYFTNLRGLDDVLENALTLIFTLATSKNETKARVHLLVQVANHLLVHKQLKHAKNRKINKDLQLPLTDLLCCLTAREAVDVNK